MNDRRLPARQHSFLALLALVFLCYQDSAAATTALSSEPVPTFILVGEPVARLPSESVTEQGPGLNKKARRTSRKARRRTLGKTRGSASKTRLSVKRQGRSISKASRKGFNRAAKRDKAKKKAGCKG